MSDKHYGLCVWTPGASYAAETPYGAVEMFGDHGQRAAEVMLLSAAACLNFYMVEYARARKLPVDRIEVRCDGEVAQRPERISHIRTRVTIEGGLSDKDAQRMVHLCEHSCKIMNTLRTPPECSLAIENRATGQAEPPMDSAGQG